MSDMMTERFSGLKGFLEHDPENPSLLRDCAEAALEANCADEALGLLDRLAGVRELEPAETNIRAIAAMRSNKPEVAVSAFAALRENVPDDPALSFNHAWALSLAGQHAEAEEALSEEAVASLPQAAMLQVQLAHQAGRFDEAADMARDHLESFPDYPPLSAAISVLAMDVEDEELARSCAIAGGDHPDAVTTLGLLTLGDSKPAEAKAMFERAVATRANSPRALIGLGLANMAEGNVAEAGKFLDQGAQIFGSHLGTWIASGWSYLLAGDNQLARERFAHALELDDTFAESHGSLAVMDVLEGNLEAAQRGCETALRLDRQCFSAAFAKVLLAAAEGDTQKAERIMQIALRQPIAEDGRTIADAIAKMAM